MQINPKGLKGCVLGVEALVPVEGLRLLDTARKSARVVRHHGNLLVYFEHWIFNGWLSWEKTGTSRVHSHEVLHWRRTDPVAEHGGNADCGDRRLRIETCRLRDQLGVDQVARRLRSEHTLGVLAPLPARSEVVRVACRLVANTDRLTIDDILWVPRVNAD